MSLMRFLLILSVVFYHTRKRSLFFLCLKSIGFYHMDKHWIAQALGLLKASCGAVGMNSTRYNLTTAMPRLATMLHLAQTFQTAEIKKVPA